MYSLQKMSVICIMFMAALSSQCFAGGSVSAGAAGGGMGAANSNAMYLIKPHNIVHSPKADVDAVRKYWTPERIRNAKPMPMPMPKERMDHHIMTLQGMPR